MKKTPSNSFLQKKSVPLCNAFLSLRGPAEMFSFLRDILTTEEMIELSNRLDIAQKLDNGESYTMIENVTNYSSTTIARVAKFLKGKFGGYRMVLRRLAKKK